MWTRTFKGVEEDNLDCSANNTRDDQHVRVCASSGLPMLSMASCERVPLSDHLLSVRLLRSTHRPRHRSKVIPKESGGPRSFVQWKCLVSPNRDSAALPWQLLEGWSEARSDHPHICRDLRDDGSPELSKSDSMPALRWAMECGEVEQYSEVHKPTIVWFSKLKQGQEILDGS